MIYYHGTTEHTSKKIFQDQKISSTAEKVYGKGHLVKETTDGYVYLTDKIRWALRYGANAIMMSDLNLSKENIIVFKINISDSYVEIDEDEIEVVSKWDEGIDDKVVDISSSLKYLNSVRIPRDLILGKDVVEYFIIPAKSDLVRTSIRDDYENYRIEEEISWNKI